LPLNKTYPLLNNSSYKEIASSLPKTFEFRWEFRVASKTTKTTTYYIYTYLRWIGGNPGTSWLIKKGSCPVVNPNTGKSESCVNSNPTTYLSGVETLARMRHAWHIVYTIDGKKETKNFNTAATWLPDDNAKKGVVHTGHLHMKKNEWYQWGPPKTGTWANDGKKHTVRVTMHMDEFGYPWNCPKAGNEASAQLTITMPTYAITPGKPTAVVSGSWYDHRVTWAAVTNAKDYKIQRKVGTGAWADIPNVGWSTSRTYTPKDHFEFEPGTSISYRVKARSSTNTETTGAATPAFNIGGGVKIKVNGVWKSGTVYIKVNGVWRRADYIATKQNDSWKISDF
jgi:hypothetical protein